MIDEKVKQASILEIFLDRVKTNPDRTVIAFYADDGKLNKNLTYREIDEKAKIIATYLKKKTSKGDRVGLMYAQSPDFIFTYFGCLYASCIPVPMNLPFRRQATNRMQAMIEDSGVQIIFTNSRLYKLLWAKFILKKVKLVSCAQVLTKSADEKFEYPNPTKDDLALLQYTSGSTGDPKGVMVSHSSMIADLTLIRKAANVHEEFVTVSWLPCFHDMGFIGGYMLPIFSNSTSVLMSPLGFLKNPETWIKIVDQLKADSSFLPNFGLGMSSSKVSDELISKIDLSNFAQIYCGSEPVRKSTIDKFMAKFSPAGLPKHAIYPCYGMAEAVLMITIGGVGTELSYITVSNEYLKKGQIEIRPDGENNTTTLYNCGYLWGDTKLEIVDPDTQTRKPAWEIGEIWVKGSIVTAGYWNKPEINDKVFNAKLKDTGESGFLRTGDLGVMIEDNLFVTGRLKDLIIVRGFNIYPHDIENVVDGLDKSFRMNNCAVFSVEGKEREEIVVLQEIRKKHEGKIEENVIFRRIQEEVSKELDVSVDKIALIPQSTLPKTTSGKIKRSSCKESYIEGSIKILHHWDATTQLEETPGKSTFQAPDEITREETMNWLKEVVAEHSKLKASDIVDSKSLNDQGIDSVEIVQITDAVEKGLGISLPPDFFWENPTLNVAVEKLIKEYKSQKT